MRRLALAGLAVVAGCSKAPEKKAASEPPPPPPEPAATSSAPPPPMVGGAAPGGADGASGGAAAGSAATEAARASGGLGSTTDGDAFRPIEQEKGGDVRKKTSAPSMNGAAPARQTVKVETPKLATPTDAKLVGGAIAAVQSGFETCYRSALALRPDLAGKMTIKFALAKGSGSLTKISFATGSLKHAELEKCVTEQVRAAKLPSFATTDTTGSFVIDFAQ